MTKQSLATKYRPNNWDTVVEQSSIKIILQHQLESNEIKSSYLFVGGAGTGKTTCARIMANAINNGEGNPIELDAASHNSVDDMRALIQQARTKSLDSEYKVFIVDECHMISTAGWNALLKLIEEPPAKSVFIFCTTDPQKIPKTIVSRIQRYDFQMISQQGIVDRLTEIVVRENSQDYDDPNLRDIGGIRHDKDAIEYIARLSDGHMRDALTMLDKCLAYSIDLTLENVVKCLGTIDYDIMFELTQKLLQNAKMDVMCIIDNIHSAGKDLKRFLKLYTSFILDINKLSIGCDWSHVMIPRLINYENIINSYIQNSNGEINSLYELMSLLINLNSSIKYSSTPKYDIEAEFMLWMLEG